MYEKKYNSRISLILGSKNIAQVTTPGYARYYYGILVQDGSGQVIEQETSGILNGRLFTRGYTNATKQQWAVMPLYITAKNNAIESSQEFVMGSRANGKVVDISDGTNVRCYLPFHGGTNQLFSLYPYSADVFAIRSQSDINKVFDKSSNNNNAIKFYAPWHGGGNQKFALSPFTDFSSAFTSLRTKNYLDIPFPPSPTSFTQQMPTETPKTFKQETLIPYHFVMNDLPPAQQIEVTPYYKVVHYQYYRQAAGNWDVTYRPGVQLQHIIRTKNGVSLSKVTEVTNKLNLSYSATGEITATIKIVSLKASSTWSAAFERSVKTVTSFSETSRRNLYQNNQRARRLTNRKLSVG